MYAYNEHDGIAHKCWFETDGALSIDSFGIFTKVSGDVPGENIGDTEEELEQLPDISGYTGCWKVENEPLYFVINDSCEWAAVNLYGEEIGPGYVVAEEDFITLCMENGEAAATSLIKGNRLAGISWITGMFEENDRCPCEHSV